MKVVYVINDLLLGGAQKLVLDLTKQFNKEKYEVVVVYLYNYENKKTTLKKDFENSNIELICLEDLAGSKNILKLAACCKNIFSELKPNIVHIHLPNALIVGGYASIITRTPFIIHEHNTHNFHTWKIKLIFAFYRIFSKLTICYAETVEKEIFHKSHVLSTSDDFMNTYPSSKVVTVLNGIDVTGLSTTRDKFRTDSLEWILKRKSIGVEENEVMVFSAARFVKWKGHHLLVEGFAKFIQKSGDTNTVLVIAGEGPEKTVCEDLAKSLGVDLRVKFIGARTDIPELLAVSDIYSLVFNYEDNMIHAEAMGLAGFEAMAAGLPVLIGDFGGASLYIQNMVNGVIVKKWDTDDLALKLEKLVGDKELRQRIGVNARERIFNLLDWKEKIKIYETIYNNLAKSK